MSRFRILKDANEEQLNALADEGYEICAVTEEDGRLTVVLEGGMTAAAAKSREDRQRQEQEKVATLAQIEEDKDKFDEQLEAEKRHGTGFHRDEQSIERAAEDAQRQAAAVAKLDSETLDRVRAGEIGEQDDDSLKRLAGLPTNVEDPDSSKHHTRVHAEAGEARDEAPGSLSGTPSPHVSHEGPGIRNVPPPPGLSAAQVEQREREAARKAGEEAKTPAEAEKERRAAQGQNRSAAQRRAERNQ